MEDELNFKTLFLRNLHPGISHHLGVLACPRTMNTQQLRDLVQKAYYKQKMASEKSAKTPAVLDFNTQHHELALEGTQRQDSAKPPHREWNAHPVQQRTRLTPLTPDLNRGMTDGMDRVDVNAHLDDTGRVVSWESVGKGRRTRVSLTSCQTERLSDKLNKSAPENSTASPCSQRTVNTLTSDGHETPPETQQQS